MILNFFFGGSHCQSVILFLDEIGGWREEGVLFNSARGQRLGSCYHGMSTWINGKYHKSCTTHFPTYR